MHEYAIVQDLVHTLLEDLRIKKQRTFTRVELRRSSTFAEDPLRQAWSMLTPGTPLAQTGLVITSVDVELTCDRCGVRHHVVADDLVGHLFICPRCGEQHHIDEAHGLEIIDVTP